MDEGCGGASDRSCRHGSLPDVCPTAQGNERESLEHDGRNWEVAKPFELSGGTCFACHAVVPGRQSAVSGPSSRENRPPCLRPVFLGTPPRAATASKLVRPGALSVREVVRCSEFRVRPLSAAAGRVWALEFLDLFVVRSTGRSRPWSRGGPPGRLGWEIAPGCASPPHHEGWDAFCTPCRSRFLQRLHSSRTT